MTNTLLGKIIHAGTDDSGQPRLIIQTTEAALRDLRGRVVYSECEVTPLNPETESERQDLKNKLVDEFIRDLCLVLESHGIDTRNWDGDEPPAFILGHAIGRLVKDLRAEKEELHVANNTCAQIINRLQLEITTLRKELEAYRTGGVTEEILRRNDGYIKVGKGCEIALEGTTAKAAKLREAVVAALGCVDPNKPAVANYLPTEVVTQLKRAIA